ncbi:MAG TPA: flagellar export protein FliJ [Spirochaetota bacterium]
MKKFKFRLEKLLEARLAKEKAVKTELAHAISEQNIFRMKQSEYHARVEEQKKKFHEKIVTGKVNFSELSMYHHFADFSEKVVSDAQQKIEAMEPAINVIRGKLAEASKERRVIEKLKEKRQKEWQYEVDRAMYNEADDANQKLYTRRLVEMKKEALHD